MKGRGSCQTYWSMYAGLERNPLLVLSERFSRYVHFAYPTFSGYQTFENVKKKNDGRSGYADAWVGNQLFLLSIRIESPSGIDRETKRCRPVSWVNLSETYLMFVISFS